MGFSKIGLFVVFNSLLPGSDVGTDFITCIDLFNQGHRLWACMTLFFMWNPFIVHSIFMAFKFCNHKIKGGPFDAKKELRELIFLFPLVTPIKNLYYGYKLYKLRYGMNDFKSKNAKKVEEIQHQVGSAGMFESFLESGPQSVVQIKIVLSTGHISTAQKISIPISILSLAWASSRAYFIQRDADKSDPDPEIKMVLMRVFPWMLINVIHGIIIWTCIAGIICE